MAALQAADELVDDTADRALVGHAALDAFGHQLQGLAHFLLEVAVGRAARHGAERAHAAIGFVAAALIEEDLARALVGAGEQRADHHAVGAGGDRLGEVAGIFDAAVGDDRHVALARPLDGIESAVSCGTPTPATMRVVQIEPGPMPTLMASAPASMSASAPSAVAILPAMTWHMLLTGA